MPNQEITNPQQETQPNYGFDPSSAMLERKEDILQLLKSTDFLIDFRNKLLGLKWIETTNEAGEVVGRYQPISPREVKANTDERIDFSQKILTITCKKCGEDISDSYTLSCNKCGNTLTKGYSCKECGIVNRPDFRCPYCHENKVIKLVVTKHYINDSALMNKSGASYVISILNFLLNPISHLGSRDRHLMLKQQRQAIFEKTVNLTLNKKRWGIHDNDVYLIDSLLDQALLPLFTLSLTKSPLSLIEAISKFYGETRVIKEGEGSIAAGAGRKWNPFK